MNLKYTWYKILSILIFTFSFTLLINTNDVKASSSNNNEKNQSLMIMLDSESELGNIAREIRMKFKNIKVKEIDAINVLVAENFSGDEIEEFKTYLKQDLGVSEDEIATDLSLDVPIVEKISHGTSLLLDNYEINSPNIYDELLWDIKLVTNNYASYQLSKGSPEIKVGIIDSGIDFNHPALKDNIISQGHSFVPGEMSTQDYLGHGTMVAGVIAADGKMKGIAPEIGLVPYKVFDAKGANSSWVIEAIIQATNDDMDVVNLSLSTFKSLKNKDDRAIIKAYEKAFRYAKKHNTTLVVSAGNEGLDITNPKLLAEQLEKPEDLIIHLPGGSNHLITVAATNKKNLLSTYSNYGKNVSILAPGGSYEFDTETYTLDLTSMTLTTFPTNLPQTFISQYLGLDHGYEMTVGTSVAAPKVTAIVALLKSEYLKTNNKEMKNEQVEKVLYQTSMKLDGYDKHISQSGIINAYNALSKMKKYK
ncbi:S8 family serine peptidase [Psychrobacillus sp. FSL K6-2836]|uniref:S8 family serine peptidase n=1 Tax=Psychrobacillus sp. FSL K6-2836 TaxID=2921548 RepID=UPI0030F66A28